MEKLAKEILALLQEDSRYSKEKLAVMTGEDVGKVSDCIEDMEKSGIIVKYTTIINEQKLGDELVEALIEVKATPQHSRGFDAIAEEIYRFDEVKSVYLMSGAYDLAVMIEGKNLREVAMFVSDKLSTLDDVLSTATHFILKKYKLHGIMIDGNDPVKRIAVQP